MSDELLTQSVNKPEWDYTEQAEFYKFRPNYDPGAIDRLLEQAGARKDDSYAVADVGAGTGNLTKMLLERGMNCKAIEPNAAMRRIGIEETKGGKVEWCIGTGENTGLADSSIDLFAMGSSFNTTEREDTLNEAKRVLKPEGWFACMWNHRELENDPYQAKVEEIIKEFYPGYSHGTRRQSQTDILADAQGFGEVVFIESTQQVQQPIDRYISAWRSVKNGFWDLTTEEGKNTFEQLMSKIGEALPEVLSLEYTTRIWMVPSA